MKSLLELGQEVEVLSNSILKEKEIVEDLKNEINASLRTIEKMESDLYTKNINLCHIKEIYRMAKLQFSRLRQVSEPCLTESDIIELNKWISRVNDEKGLIDIRNALVELDKYLPSEIKSNIYALVQTIIVGGAYGQNKPKVKK